MPRSIVLLLAVVLLLSLSTVASSQSEEPAPRSSAPEVAATDELPDLGMARLTDFRFEKGNGKRLLRFSSVVANVGEGKFELRGTRTDSTAETMTVQQRLFSGDGSSRLVSTDAVMYFGGDGHNHWHVRDLEDFELRRLHDMRKLRVGAKHGFCFFDNTRFGSDEDPIYSGCGGSGDTSVEMGLSPGWADIYKYSLPDQYIDTTGLPKGRYRLTGIADNDDWFAEGDEANNITWVNLEFANGKIRVLKYGPSARPISP